MRKRLGTRMIGLAVLYCVIFCVLVIMQFSNSGNFSYTIEGMSLRGRYVSDSLHGEYIDEENLWSNITGGVKVFYGGLEFNLKEERGKGLLLTDTEGTVMPVNPDFMFIAGNTARFHFPGGTVITFNSLDSLRGPEIQITGEFADNDSEILIPIIPRRSSIIQDSGQLGIMYSGSRYVFTTLGQELENGYMVLSKNNEFISYRSRGRQREFNPEDYVIGQARNYDRNLRSWQDTSFSHWNQNPSSLHTEDDIIAYLSGALTRGFYPAAVQNIPMNFVNSTRQTYRSSVFTGGMLNAYRSFTSSENEKIHQITRQTRERSLEFLKEENILNYLFVRSNISLANDVINIITNAPAESLTADLCPGLLEVYYDIRLWRPEAGGLIDHMTEYMLALISDNLSRDVENDFVFASNSEGINIEYSARLGKALIYWADTTQNEQWSAIGRSLVLSAVSTGNTGKLHNILKPADYFPKALLLASDGLWAWTISQSFRAAYAADSNLTFTVSFPVNMTHHIIIRGVQPFLRIQIHNVDWRTDSQFERYDSSGWVYYPEEQILILKLRHRSSVENVRLIYREAPRVLPPPPPAENFAADEIS